MAKKSGQKTMRKVYDPSLEEAGGGGGLEQPTIFLQGGDPNIDGTTTFDAEEEEIGLEAGNSDGNGDGLFVLERADGLLMERTEQQERRRRRQNVGIGAITLFACVVFVGAVLVAISAGVTVAIFNDKMLPASDAGPVAPPMIGPDQRVYPWLLSPLPQEFDAACGIIGGDGDGDDDSGSSGRGLLRGPRHRRSLTVWECAEICAAAGPCCFGTNNLAAESGGVGGTDTGSRNKVLSSSSPPSYACFEANERVCRDYRTKCQPILGQQLVFGDDESADHVKPDYDDNAPANGEKEEAETKNNATADVDQNGIVDANDEQPRPAIPATTPSPPPPDAPTDLADTCSYSDISTSKASLRSCEKACLPARCCFGDDNDAISAASSDPDASCSSLAVCIGYSHCLNLHVYLQAEEASTDTGDEAMDPAPSTYNDATGDGGGSDDAEEDDRIADDEFHGTAGDDADDNDSTGTDAGGDIDESSTINDGPDTDLANGGGTDTEPVVDTDAPTEWDWGAVDDLNDEESIAADDQIEMDAGNVVGDADDNIFVDDDGLFGDDDDGSSGIVDLNDVAGDDVL